MADMKNFKLTKSIFRIMSILDLFSAEQTTLNVAEISKKTGIPLTTTYRILADLRQVQLLEQDDHSGKYRIGIKLYLLGNMYLRSQNIIKIAEPVVKTLNELTNESIFIELFEKGDVMLIYKEESRHPFKYSHTVGMFIPAHATAVGKAFLSELSNTEIDKLYPEEYLRPLTIKTITSKEKLKEELKQVRKTGVALAYEESYKGVLGIASLIRDDESRAIATLSIGMPVFRLQEHSIESLATIVKMGASLISFRLGYQKGTCLVHDTQEIRSWWSREVG